MISKTAVLSGEINGILQGGLGVYVFRFIGDGVQVCVSYRSSLSISLPKAPEWQFQDSHRTLQRLGFFPFLAPPMGSLVVPCWDFLMGF